jgi:hypothetical protein
MTRAEGPVSVAVANNGVVSAPTAQLQAAAHGLFQWGATDYAVVTRFPDNALRPCASVSRAGHSPLVVVCNV